MLSPSPTLTVKSTMCMIKSFSITAPCLGFRCQQLQNQLNDPTLAGRSARVWLCRELALWDCHTWVPSSKEGCAGTRAKIWAQDLLPCLDNTAGPESSWPLLLWGQHQAARRCGAVQASLPSLALLHCSQEEMQSWGQWNSSGDLLLSCSKKEKVAEHKQVRVTFYKQKCFLF